MKTRLLVAAVLLPALAGVLLGAPVLDRHLKKVMIEVRAGLRELELRGEDVRPGHDFIPADEWRLPLVDAYLDDPLAAPEDAGARFGPWLDAPAGLTTLLRRAAGPLGYDLGGVAGPAPAGTLAAEITALYADFGADRPAEESVMSIVNRIPKKARAPLARLLAALRHVVKERQAACAKLSETEWVRLRQYGSQLNTGMPVSEQAPMLRSHHAKVDGPRIFRASLALAQALEELAAAAGEFTDGPAFEVGFTAPAGPVMIGGFGPNTYPDDCLLSFDFGGDDVYTNSAGGTLYLPMKVSVCVDLAGNDVYRTTVGLAQGSGMYGVGMLLDLAGNDDYDTKNVSQGSGHLGVGVLWDVAGDDRYTARSVSQGTGYQGVGILLDEAGRDVYRVGMLGQGLGLPQGFGVLLDRGGDDVYRAGGLMRDEPREPERFLSLAQGFGQGVRADDPSLSISGGIGLLADLAGDDLYEADVFGQGCSYWYGLGVLLDGEGNDHYEVHNYGQGAGIHMAVGLQMDLAGDDRYYGAGHALGHALDRGFGFFADFAGDDLYDSRDGESQGAAVKPHALGIFADLAGDDTYRGGGNGYVRVPDETYEGQWPKAFFLDLEGKDRYAARAEEPADGKRWTRNTYGFGRDR